MMVYNGQGWRSRQASSFKSPIIKPADFPKGAINANPLLGDRFAWRRPIKKFFLKYFVQGATSGSAIKNPPKLAKPCHASPSHHLYQRALSVPLTNTSSLF